MTRSYTYQWTNTGVVTLLGRLERRADPLGILSSMVAEGIATKTSDCASGSPANATRQYTQLLRVFDNSATQGSRTGDGSRNGEGQGPDTKVQGSLEREKVYYKSCQRID